MPSNVLLRRPSWRERLNAKSRFGPAVPVVPARASVWQPPHFWANRVFPLTRLAPLLLSWQPLSPSAATPRLTISGAYPPLLMAGHPNRHGRHAGPPGAFG